MSGVATCASVPHCPLLPFTAPYLPFKLVGVDLFESVLTSTSQTNWTLVAIDRLKRYVKQQTFPMPEHLILLRSF